MRNKGFLALLGALFFVFGAPYLADANYRSPSVSPTTCTTHQWVSTISAGLVPSCSQPAFTDVSGSVAAAQMPALTGSCTTTAGAVATTCEQDGLPTAYTPSLGITGGGVAPGSASATGNWKLIGNKFYYVSITYTVATLGSGAGNQTFSLPSITAGAFAQVCWGQDASTAQVVGANIGSGGTTITFNAASAGGLAAHAYIVACMVSTA